MTWETLWPAPAKLNLMLRVLGRRSDGYHRLQTVFQFLDYGDELRFRLRQDGQVRRVNPIPGIPAESDLILRAAKRLQAYSGTGWGVEIGIHKRLPLGAGLGGGSSDAATVLVALNQLWQTGLSLDQLAEIGLSLGADVPVFIHGHAAWAEGIGEKLTPMPALPEPWYLVLIPACQVSTAAVFADPHLTRNSPEITIKRFISGEVRNDCLAVVRRRYPQVAEALDWLAQYGQARLTGTGACVFAAFPDCAQARRVCAQVPDGIQAFIARGMNRSPLWGKS